MEESAPATKTEQKEGTEDSTITPVSKTDVIEREDKSETSNEGILEKETEDTSEGTENGKQLPDENMMEASDNSLDLVPAGEVTVTYKQINYNETGSAAVSYDDVSDVAVDFTNNSVDSATGQVNSDVDYITFKVTPAPGKKIKEVKYALADSAEGLAFDQKPALSGVSGGGDNTEYTIPAKIKDLVSKKKVVGVYVGVETITYSVTITDANNSTSVKPDAGDYNFGSAVTTKSLKYGETVIFATTTGSGDSEKVNVKAGASGTTGGNELALSGHPGALVATPATKYVEYVLDPREISAVATNADDTITITVTAKTPHNIAVQAPVITQTKSTPARNTYTVDAVGLDAGTYANLEAATVTADKKIAFTLENADEQYKLKSVTAFWVASTVSAAVDVITEEQKHVVGVSKKTATVSEESVEYYEITLAEIPEANAKLYVLIDAELDDSIPEVKIVSVNGDSNVVAAETSAGLADSKKNLVGKSFKSTDDAVSLYAQAVDGYAITKVEYTIEKKYTATGAVSPVTYEVNASGTKLAENEKFVPETGVLTLNVPFTDTDETEGEWTTQNVKVNITTAVDVSRTDKEVTFVSKGSYTEESKGAYGIAVETEDGKVEILDEAAMQYTVKAGTDYIQFKVMAQTAPVIEAGTKVKIAEEVGRDDEGITYRIPAALLGNTSTVWVTRDTKKVNVNYTNVNYTGVDTNIAVNVTDVDAGVTNISGTDALTPEEAYSKQTAYDVAADAQVRVAVKATGNTPITSVTYSVGNGSVQEAKYNDTEGFFLEVKASDEVTVNVSRSTEKKLKLTKVGGGVLTPDGNGVYNIGYNDEIKAEIFDKDAAVVLYNAAVTVAENNSTASTSAVLAADKLSASIKVRKNEQNTDLKVTLITYADRVPVSFVIRTQTPVGGVSYEGSIADGKLSLPVDTKEVLQVSLKDTANAELGNLEVSIVGKDAKVVTTQKLLENNVAVALDAEGKLTVTAAPATGAGKADAVRVALYDENDPDKTIIPGSDFIVSTTDATVKNKEFTVAPGTSTARNVVVNIGIPEGVRTDLVVGKVWYKVEITKPDAKTVNAMSADAKLAWSDDFSGNTMTEWVALETIAQNGGYYSVPVFKSTITKTVDGQAKTVAFPGEGVQGFKVKATLVQATAGKTKTNAEDASAVKGGFAETAEAYTSEPYYENTDIKKLKVKAVKHTIYTGNSEPVVVARPEFSADAKYKSVKVTFVNLKDNTEKGASYGDLTASYNESTGDVVVSSAGRYQYNELGYYKDLGVKISAMTENTEYGLAGTAKLTIVNGIEDITVKAQPQVKKGGSLKLETELNNVSIKKGYAPKSSKVTYEIVAPDTNEDAVNDGTYQPAKAASFVTVKNGKLTVNKKYVIDKTPVNNQFKVLVRGADYAGNKNFGLTADAITITDQSVVMGTLVILKQGEHGWGDAVTVSGSLPVTAKGASGYRLAILKPDITADRKTYDCDTDIVDPENFTFSPAKGNIRVDREGFITVEKLGKATLSAVDKTDKKNKQQLKNVAFVQKSAKLGLLIKRYEASSLKGGYYDQRLENTFEFAGDNTNYFGLDIVDLDSKDPYNTKVELSDVKLSFKDGAKNITPKNNAEWTARYGNVGVFKSQYVIAVTGKKATINFQSKSQGKQVYTIVNTAYKTEKAPKVTPNNQKVTQGNPSDLTFKVTKDKTSFDGKYVMVKLDNTKKNPDGAGSAFEVGGTAYLDNAIAIRDNGEFNIKIDPVKTGNYYLSVAVGSLNGGIFEQEYADAKVTVKSAASGSIKLKVTGKYELDERYVATKKIVYNEKDGKAWYTNTNADNIASNNFAMNAVANHAPNHFRDYFEAKAVYNANTNKYELDTIGLKPGLDAKQIAYITSEEGAKDRVGYISVQNKSRREDVKITITFKSVASKLKAVCSPVMTGSDMVADIVLYNGKERVAVKSFTGGGDGFTKDNKDFLINQIIDPETKAVLGGDIRLKAKNLDAGKKTINLKVVPYNTPNLYKADEKNALDLTFEIKVVKSDMTKKVKLDVKEWKVASSDFVGPTSDANTPKQGSWQKDISYTFKSSLSLAEGTPINVTCANDKTPYISFVGGEYSNAGQTRSFKAVIDKEKLAAAIAADKKLNWGKKITVNAVFAYGDAKHPANLKEDKVSLKITLPGEPKADDTAALAKDLESTEADIKNVINTMTAHNRTLGITDNDVFTAKNNEVKSKIEARLKSALNGATANVEVTYVATKAEEKDTQLATSWTWKVMDANGKVFYGPKTHGPAAETSISDIEDYLDPAISTSWTYNSWEAGKALTDADENKLFTLTPKTTYSEYAAMVRNMLVKKLNITNNILVTVQDVSVKEPTLKATGSYTATILLRDKSLAPSDADYQRHLRNVAYTFPTVEAVNTAVGRISTELTDTKLVEIVGKAWDSVAETGMTYTNSTFYDKVTEALVAEANKIIGSGNNGTSTGNENLKAAGIEAGSLKMVIGNNNVSEASVNNDVLKSVDFILNLTDSTPGAKDAAFSQKITKSLSSGSGEAVPEMQTMLGLKTAATAKALTIKKVDSEEAAYEAVKAKIQTLVKNKALDMETVIVKPATTKKYVAVSGSKSGLVSVNAKFGTIVAVDILNIVILADGEDFKDNLEGADGADADAKKADSKIRDQIAKMILAEVNKESVTKAVKDLQVTYANEEGANTSGDAPEAGDIKIAIEKMVGPLLTGTGYEFKTALVGGSTYAGANITTEGSFALPTGAANKAVIPEFKVTLKKAGATPDVLYDVVVKSFTLNAIPEYQSEDEAKAKLQANAKIKSGFDVRYLGLEANDTGDLTQGFKTASATKLNAELKSIVEDMKLITNPLYIIAAEASADSGKETVYSAGTVTDKWGYKATNWKISLNKKKASGDAELVIGSPVYIREVRELNEANTAYVKYINFDKVDGVTVEHKDNLSAIKDDKLGRDADHPIDLNTATTRTTALHDEFDITLKEVKLSEAATAEGARNVTWKIEDGNAAHSNPADKDIQGITFDEAPNGIRVKVPHDATGNGVAGDTAGHKILLKVTATSKTKNLAGAAEVAAVYVQLNTVPKINSIVISGPDTVEVADNGQNASDAAYTATVTGDFLTDTEKTASVKWTLENNAITGGGTAGKLDTTASTAAGSTNLTFPSTNAAAATTTKVTLKATSAMTGDTLSQTKDIAVKHIKTANKPDITLGDAAGFEVDKLQSTGNTDVNKITVTGNNVRIPLIVGGDGEGRAWDTVALVDGSDSTISTGTVKIEKSADEKLVWLVVTEDQTELKDEELNEDRSQKTAPEQMIKITMTSTGSGATSNVVTNQYVAALVVKQNVTGIKLKSWGTDGSSDEGDPTTKSQSTIPLNKDSSAQTLTLQPIMEGTHVPAAENQKVTYKITGKDRTMSASIATQPEADTTNGKGTVTIAADAYGSLEITATYGTGENAVTAKRVIYVKNGSTEKTYTIKKSGDASADIDNLVIGAYTADDTITYGMHDGLDFVSNVSNVTWTLTYQHTDLKGYVSLDPSTGVLTVKSNPEGYNDPELDPLAPGTYGIGLKATYDDINTKTRYTATKSVNIVVKKVVGTITATASSTDEGLGLEASADNDVDYEITASQAGKITINVSMTPGERGTAGDVNLLQYAVTGDVTKAATPVASGKGEVDVPNTLAANKTFTVTISVPAAGELADTAPATTKALVFKVVAATP